MKSYPKKRRAWEDSELRRAKTMLRRGKAIPIIARAVQRTEGALRQKLFAENISVRELRAAA